MNKDCSNVIKTILIYARGMKPLASAESLHTYTGQKVFRTCQYSNPNFAR